MMLCNWHGYWFLSTGINRAKDFCAVRCGALMPHPEGFIPLPPIGIAVYGAVSPVSEVVFYSSLFYRGCRVSPEHWHPDSSEPLVNCRLETHDLRPSLLQHMPDYTSSYPDFHRRVTEEGWQWDMKDGGTKYIHVDDLEKVEGPPSEGAF